MALNGLTLSYVLWSYMVKYRNHWTCIVFSRGHKSKFSWSCLEKQSWLNLYYAQILITLHLFCLSLKFINQNFRFSQNGDENEPLNLHLTRECYQFWHVTFLLPKASRYTEKINTLIMRMIDTGIINKFYQNEMDKISTLDESLKKEAVPVALAVSHLGWIHLTNP